MWRHSARRFYYTFESAFEVSGNFRGSYAARYMHEAEQRKLQDCSLAQRPYSMRFAPTCGYVGEREQLQRCIKADEIGCSHSPRWMRPGALAGEKKYRICAEVRRAGIAEAA